MAAGLGDIMRFPVCENTTSSHVAVKICSFPELNRNSSNGACLFSCWNNASRHLFTGLVPPAPPNGTVIRTIRNVSVTGYRFTRGCR